MKQSMLKRALLTACLSVSMAGVAMAGPVGPVIIPQAGDVVVINHGPDMTFTGNINFDVESQTNNNLQVGSTVIPNVVYGAAFNKAQKMGRMLSQRLAMLTKKVLTGM